MLHCFMTIFTHSWTPCYSTICYSSRIMYHIVGFRFPRIDLRNILKTSNKWSVHHIYPTWTNWIFIGCGIEVYSHARSPSYGQLSRQHGSKSHQGSSDYFFKLMLYLVATLCQARTDFKLGDTKGSSHAGGEV